MMNPTEIAKLSNVLRDYFLGDLIPRPGSIVGMYDRDAWVVDWYTYFANNRPVVECKVEYVENAGQYRGEGFYATITEYSAVDHKFSKARDFWPIDVVKSMDGRIVVDLSAKGH